MLESLGIEPRVLAIQVAIFLVLFFFLKRVLFDRVLRGIEDREKEVRSAMEKVRADWAETDKLVAEYKARLAAVEKEEYGRMQEDVRRAQQDRAHRIEEAHAEARAMLDRARLEIRREQAEALESVGQRVDELARAAVSRILKGEES